MQPSGAFGQGRWNDSYSTFSLMYKCFWFCLFRNPQAADVFLSASGDCTVKIWDVRQPEPSLSFAAHQFEILSADWCKYNDCIIATGSVDKTIKIWDVRMPQRELSVLHGHTYAIRRVVFSPHMPTILASCGYDMTVGLWDYAAPEDAALKVWGHHTEFAVGLDFSTLEEGILASCGWDEMTYLWHQTGNPVP